MRIFILSDHPLFGQGIESLIGQQTGLQTVGRASDIQQAMPQIQELRPDIVILDSSNWPSGPAPVALPILAQELGTRVIALNLDDNSMSIYRGERRIVKEVKDLLEAIEDE